MRHQSNEEIVKEERDSTMARNKDTRAEADTRAKAVAFAA